MGRPRHNIRSGLFESETHVRKTRGNHDEPDNLNRREREHGEALLVLENETNEEDESLGKVLGQDVKNKLLHVVEHAATFFHGVRDRGKVIVGENDVRCVLGDVRSGNAHGNTDVGTLERGRVVDTVTGLEESVLILSEGTETS